MMLLNPELYSDVYSRHEHHLSRQEQVNEQEGKTGYSVEHYKRILRLGNSMMLISAVATLTTIMIAYILFSHFSIGTQVTAHIVMLLAVTGIKIGYILRCIGRQGLGAKIL